MDLPPDPREPVDHRVAARLVDRVDLGRVGPRLLEHDRRRDLDGLERAVVQIALELRERVDHVWAPHEERDPPASHRERLRHRVQLDRDLLGADALQDRRRLPPVERHVGVREVVHQHHVALARPVHEALQVGELDGRRRRVVREREHDDARPWPPELPRLHHPVDVPRAVGPAADRDLSGVRTRQVRPPDVDRVARCRDDRRVPGLEQHPHEVAEPLLGPDRREHLEVRVKLDAERAQIVIGDGLAQLRDAARRRVAVVARVPCGLAQLLDGDRRRRQVRVSEAQVDDVATGAPGLELDPVDDREDVGRQAGDASEFHDRTLVARDRLRPALAVDRGRRRLTGDGGIGREVRAAPACCSGHDLDVEADR